MQGRTFVLFVIAVCFVVGTVLAADITVGTWKINVAKSKYSPGPAPKAQTSKVETMGDNMKVTIDGTDAEGKPVHNEWVGKYDGKDYPVKGDPNTDTRAYKKIDDYNFEVTAKKAGKVTTTSKVAYAREGKSRTNMQTGMNAKGQKINNTIVYDKQ